jgi:hypothetical protein
VQRLSILIVALLIGAAAPARAWCEATCLAPSPSESATPHCPSHEQPTDGPSLSAAADADCPAIDSARRIQVKVDFSLAPVPVSANALAPPHTGTIALRHPGTQAPRHPRSLPLRI